MNPPFIAPHPELERVEVGASCIPNGDTEKTFSRTV